MKTYRVKWTPAGGKRRTSVVSYDSTCADAADVEIVQVKPGE